VNAWDILKPAPTPHSPFAWTWQDEAIESEIRQLRLARRTAGFSKIDAYRQAQTHTNLGIALSTLGRFFEAIECFDRAITTYPAHGMARGNRGICLFIHVYMLPNLTHSPGLCTTAKFYQESQEELIWALKLPGERDAHEGFSNYLRHVTDIIQRCDSAAGFTQDEGLDFKPLSERLYRSWCLKNRLFLNPLNDIRTHSDAACDVLQLPAFGAFSQQARLLAVRGRETPILIDLGNCKAKVLVKGRKMALGIGCEGRAESPWRVRDASGGRRYRLFHREKR
jgi:tetratricopeptide (TPR) repeat protein